MNMSNLLDISGCSFKKIYEIVRYKARLVAKSFSRKPDIDHKMFSPIVDAVTFQFLVSLATFEGLDMYLMDIVTAYLYGSVDSYIYMKILE